jgi:hypothetical protein
MEPTQKPKKWSSGTVGLLVFGGVIGGLILTSPPPPPAPLAQSDTSDRKTAQDADWEPVRNQYADKEQCVEDYSEAECRPAGASSGSGLFYFGPWYRSNWRSYTGAGDAGPGRYAKASPSGLPRPGVQIAGGGQMQKGGFGATGRSYSSRGGFSRGG